MGSPSWTKVRSARRPTYRSAGWTSRSARAVQACRFTSMTVASARTTRGRGGSPALEVDAQAVDARAVGAGGHRLLALRRTPRPGPPAPPGHERPEGEVVAVRRAEVARRRGHAPAHVRAGERAPGVVGGAHRHRGAAPDEERPLARGGLHLELGPAELLDLEVVVVLPCRRASRRRPRAAGSRRPGSSSSAGRARGRSRRGRRRARRPSATSLPLRVDERPVERGHRRRQRLDVAARPGPDAPQPALDVHGLAGPVHLPVVEDKEAQRVLSPSSSASPGPRAHHAGLGCGRIARSGPRRATSRGAGAAPRVMRARPDASDRAAALPRRSSTSPRGRPSARSVAHATRVSSSANASRPMRVACTQARTTWFRVSIRGRRRAARRGRPGRGRPGEPAPRSRSVSTTASGSPATRTVRVDHAAPGRSGRARCASASVAIRRARPPSPPGPPRRPRRAARRR